MLFILSWDRPQRPRRRVFCWCQEQVLHAPAGCAWAPQLLQASSLLLADTDWILHHWVFRACTRQALQSLESVPSSYVSLSHTHTHTLLILFLSRALIWTFITVLLALQGCLGESKTVSTSVSGSPFGGVHCVTAWVRVWRCCITQELQCARGVS